MLTRDGREVIAELQKTGRHEEANILAYLGKIDGATVGQVAEFMQFDQDVAHDKLRSLSARRWVWFKQTKLTPF